MTYKILDELMAEEEEAAALERGRTEIAREDGEEVDVPGNLA